MNLCDFNEKELSPQRRLFFFFMPPVCLLCREVENTPLCPHCMALLTESFEPEKFIAIEGNGYADSILRLFPYQNSPVKPLILTLKRRDSRKLRRIFRFFLQKSLPRLPKDIHGICYLPRRLSTRHRYGVDQGKILAEELSTITGLPLLPLLKRQGISKAQHSLPLHQRPQNVAGVFRATRPLFGENVLLIDDIVTSGASASEAAHTLKKAGAMKVYVLCLAHGREHAKDEIDKNETLL